MSKFYPILKTNKKKQKTLPLSLPPQSFRYCLLFAFWHCQIYWKNHGPFFLPSHSLPKCNLTSDPTSLLTWLQIKKPVIFNLDAVRIPLNIYFVHIKTLLWCSLLPHLLLSLLISLVCSFQTVCSIDIDVPPTLYLWCLLCLLWKDSGQSCLCSRFQLPAIFLVIPKSL